MSASAPEQPVIEADCDHWCRTAARNSIKTSFMWTIENFLERPEAKNDPLFSSVLSVTGPGPDTKITRWVLELHHKGIPHYKGMPDLEPEEDDEHVSVYLQSEDAITADVAVPFQIQATATFSLIDSSDKEQETFSKTYSDDIDGMAGDIIALDKLRNNSITLLPDANLKILCKLEVFGQADIFSGSKESFNKTKIMDECQKQVMTHFGNLLAEKNLADLEINCDGEVFNCHQNILSARSPVFFAMFQVDMIENHSKKVHIRDVNKEVFSELLKFIYTGSVSSEDSLKEQAKDILAAANKYQLDLLKELCEAQLVSTLNASNCLDLLVLGDLHEAAKLKMAALDFVSINSASLIETDGYKDFFQTQYSDLVFEVTNAMVPKKESSSSCASPENNN